MPYQKMMSMNLIINEENKYYVKREPVHAEYYCIYKN